VPKIEKYTLPPGPIATEVGAGSLFATGVLLQSGPTHRRRVDAAVAAVGALA
jgi:hypothetical protein